MSNRPFSEEMHLIVLAGWQAGTPTEEIAAMVGRRPHAVQLYAARLRVRRPRWYLTKVRQEAAYARMRP